MRRAPIRICLALIASLALVAALASVPATARPIPPHARLELKASDGWTASVETGDGKARLAFVKRGSVNQAVQYSVRAKTTAGGFTARFGSLGGISVKFTPARPGGNRGVFRGTIRFRGEDGYVELNARRANGAMIGGPRRPLRQTAGGPAEASADTVLGVLVAATRESSLVAIASHPNERELPAFAAATRERRAGIEILRKVSVSATPDSFVFDDNLSTATIRPPAPFAGSAAFTRNADGSGSWSGDLAVDLPGRADLPLTSPEFEVVFRHNLFG
jgi:hypothetical protein